MVGQLACMPFCLIPRAMGAAYGLSTCMPADKVPAEVDCHVLDYLLTTGMNQKAIYGGNGVSPCIYLHAAVWPPTKCHVLDNRSDQQPVHNAPTVHQLCAPAFAQCTNCARTVHQVARPHTPISPSGANPPLAVVRMRTKVITLLLVIMRKV